MRSNPLIGPNELPYCNPGRCEAFHAYKATDPDHGACCLCEDLYVHGGEICVPELIKTWDAFNMIAKKKLSLIYWGDDSISIYTGIESVRLIEGGHEINTIPVEDFGPLDLLRKDRS
jgi:hypothetical protein